MKKSIAILSAAAAALMVVTACSGSSKEDSVKKFADTFGRQASTGRLDSVRLVYPDASLADTIMLAFNPDSVTIGEMTTDSTVTINYGKAASVTVQLRADTVNQVLSSHDLFAFPTEKVAQLTKYGAWDKSLTDAELARRVGDTDFDKWLASRSVSMANALTATASGSSNPYYEAFSYVIGVRNNLDVPVSGSDYSVSVKIGWGTDYPGAAGTEYKSFKGKDLPAHGSATVGSQMADDLFGKSVTWKLSPEEFAAKYVPVTGHEWADYQASKK